MRQRTNRKFSRAAMMVLTLVMAGCSSDDGINDTPQQPANTGKRILRTDKPTLIYKQ